MFRDDTPTKTKPANARFTARKWIVFLGAFAAMYLSAGIVVDYGKAYAAESRLQVAIDATASILAAEAPRASLRSLQIKAEDRLARQLRITGDPAAIVSVTVIGKSVRVSASARIGTIFLSLFQRPRLPIAATATATPLKSRSLYAMAFNVLRAT